MRIFALEGERSPKTGSLKTPERVLLADPARVDWGIGQMEIGTARIGSVLEEWLIVAGFAESYSSAEMQNLGHAVELAIDRRPTCACGEGHILIPGEAGKSGAGVGRSRKPLAKNARRQVHSAARNTRS